MTPKAWAAHRAEMYGIPMEASLCPACGGLGWVRAAGPHSGEIGLGQLCRCPVCAADTRLEWITKHCGLLPNELNTLMHDWRLGNWPDAVLTEQRKKAKEAIESAIASRSGFATFWGDFGAGKTFALKIIVNEMRLKQVESFYAPFAVVLDHLRSMFRTGVESSYFWERLLDIPVLALDEVTRFYDTGWARERLWMMADIRYRRNTSHLTVFATNDDPHEPLPTGEPVGYLYSRLRQGKLIELRGDMRPAVAQGE